MGTTYRDDTCAVCGESLPPDHFYCREHAATVDDRLHQLGAVLRRLGDDLPEAARLLCEVAPETWDYLSEQEAGEPEWPPAAAVNIRAHPDEVDVDLDTEPGQVRVTLKLGLPALVAAVSGAIESGDLERFADACAGAEGANATH